LVDVLFPLENNKPEQLVEKKMSPQIPISIEGIFLSYNFANSLALRFQLT
jgi:hypothetical protein